MQLLSVGIAEVRSSYRISVSRRIRDIDPPYIDALKSVAIGIKNGTILLALGLTTLKGLPASTAWLQVAAWTSFKRSPFRVYIPQKVACRSTGKPWPTGSFPAEVRHRPYYQGHLLCINLNQPLTPR